MWFPRRKYEQGIDVSVNGYFGLRSVPQGEVIGVVIVIVFVLVIGEGEGEGKGNEDEDKDQDKGRGRGRGKNKLKLAFQLIPINPPCAPSNPSSFLLLLTNFSFF